MENQPQELAGSCKATACEEECVGLSNGRPVCLEDRFKDECLNSLKITGGMKYCFVKKFLKWHAARDSCISMGAHLLIIETEAEQNFIQRQAFGEKWWIGGTDVNSEGTYYWEHSNSALNYTNWMKNEPNGGSRENCIEVLYLGDWNDKSCYTLTYYICEK
ncbi:hepatic lectin-like [Saccostrea cucullata]|uniref:hepatic lectin-like n=1 Tax=Saccostrea cuccullata TaxID=36930 RepID=UPI002ED415DA